MEIKDNRENNKLVTVGDIAPGDCFIHDGGDVWIKGENHCSIRLLDGLICNFDVTEKVMKERCEAHIYD